MANKNTNMWLPLVWVAIVFSVFSLPSVSADGNYQLIYADDFDEFDVSFWQHEITMGGGGNWEFEMYTNNRSTSYVENGVLYLRPRLTAEAIGEDQLHNGYTLDLWGSSPANLCTGNAFYGCTRTAGAGGNILNPIMSARIRTVNSLNLKYGKVEVRAKLPQGDWLWPAIWLLPQSNAYGEWPASGEIDIVESRGNDPNPNPNFQGRDVVSSTLHWGPHWPENGYQFTHQTFQLEGGKTFADDFHVFSLEWSPSLITTFVDGKPILKVDLTTTDFWNRGGWGNSTFNNPWKNREKNAPFDQPFYLLINLAVGGVNGYFAEGFPNKPWANASPHAANEFYAAKDRWYPTWKSDNPDVPSALRVDFVKFYCDADIPGSCRKAPKWALF